MTRFLRFQELSHASQERGLRAQTLVDRSNVAMYTSENDRFSYVNARFARTLGYTVEEILALDSVTDVIVDEHRERVQEMIRRREAGEDDARYTIRARCEDGRVLEIEIYRSVADVDGRRVVIGVAVDVTAQAAAAVRSRSGRITSAPSPRMFRTSLRSSIPRGGFSTSARRWSARSDTVRRS